MQLRTKWFMLGADTIRSNVQAKDYIKEVQVHPYGELGIGTLCQQLRKDFIEG